MITNIIELANGVESPVIARRPKEVTIFLKMVKSKTLKPKGRYFTMELEHQSQDPSKGTFSSSGIARLNRFQIKSIQGKKRITIMDTGMVQYRGAYAYEQDDWDLQIRDFSILEENSKSATFAWSTGAGSIQVWSYQNDELKEICYFDHQAYLENKKRKALVGSISTDPVAYLNYVEKSYREDRWHMPTEFSSYYDLMLALTKTGKRVDTDSGGKMDKVYFMLAIAKHSDRPFDAMDDAYQFHVWVRGKGFWSSIVFFTGMRHKSSGSTRAIIRPSAIIEQGKVKGFEIELAGYPDWTQKHRLQFK